MPATSRLDPYAILEVDRSATPLQVARAHRRLAKRHHPDLHAGTESALEAAEQMRRINEAWQLLSNPARRLEFDRTYPTAGIPHDAGVGPTGGHWASTRAPIRPSAPASTRTWATWRATAADTRAAPRTVRQPGEVHVPRTRRPPRPDPAPSTFRDSPWAALLVAALIVLLLAGAVVAGRLAL